ncbi:probable leucine-rich repeat receptor-like protein kinase At1g35710 [Eucalyptus grandis]|uniref:probable leucine-rich repeat receptor-like protein kinase At1g35710 n=1 Tax=Eucalyptus grandis TaxID=71139 RepID=UPI00192EBFEA|nr:probable leucine-rich repeat receptor-like protein kinase At1g35710 [Eucalyptus grandis]
MSLIFMMYSCTPVTLVSFNDEKALPGSVSEINLSSSSLSGRLHALDFASFPNLTCFNVSNNNLKGPIQSSIGNLSELRFLGLGSNLFEASLENCRQIYAVALLFNNSRLRGVIHGSTARLLEELFRADEKWGECKNLTKLQIDGNQITGRIPPELGKLSQLRVLTLHNNDLTGKIPTEMGNLGELLSLNLSNNHLVQDIPILLGNLAKRNYHDLSKNAMSGSIPDEQANCENLLSLNLSYNNLSSVIPPELGNLLALQILLDPTHNSLIIWERLGKFTFSNITKDTNDFSKEHHIRKGGFGSVYEAVLANGQIVAVKKLNALEPRNISEVNHRSFENEIRMSTEVRHRNVIKFHGFCSSRGCICLVYEFVERGSLAKVLYGGTEAAELDWGTRVKIVQGMAHVIAYLHHNCSLPIVHWDITLNNILLESNLKPWFSNFGMVRLLNSNLPGGPQWPDLMATWLLIWCSGARDYDGEESEGSSLFSINDANINNLGEPKFAAKGCA